MRNLLTLVFVCCFALVAFAQEDDVHRTLDEKLSNLKFGTSYEKILVLEFIGNFKDKDVFEQRGLEALLLRILRDKEEDPRVRYSSVEAIRKLMLTRMINRFSIGEDLMSIVRDDSAHIHVRSGCVRTVGVLMSLNPGEPRVEKYIVYMRDLLKLPKKDNELRIAVIRTICKLGDTAAESALNFALSDPDLVHTAVDSIYELLSSGGDLTSVVIATKLLKAFENRELTEETRVKAGDCLCFMVRNGILMDSTLDDVADIVADPKSSAAVTVTACKILYTINDRKSLRPIIDRLEDEKLDAETRVKMIQILGDFFRQIKVTNDTKRAVNNALSKFGRFINMRDLENNESFKYDASVRRVAAFAIGQVQDGFNRRGAVLLLFNALGDPDETVAEMAYESLKVLTRQDFGMDVNAWRSWFEKSSYD